MARAAIATLEGEVRSRLGHAIYGSDDDSPTGVVQSLLQSLGKTCARWRWGRVRGHCLTCGSGSLSVAALVADLSNLAPDSESRDKWLLLMIWSVQRRCGSASVART